MMDDHSGFGGRDSKDGDLIEIDLNFDSMRRFQAEFSQNLSEDGIFIDTGEPLSPGSVVRFRIILPEDFVFLEGTSVVEWTKSAEEIGEGPPGMALRFVTLSPQNQELVAQLVQDHRNAGGTPFDIDFRPVPTDFPTDALEGALPPASIETSLDEGFRLTVRRTEPDLEAEALQALAEAAPGAADDAAPETAEATEPTDAGPEDARDFAIVSGLPDGGGRDAGAAADVEIDIQESPEVAAASVDEDLGAEGEAKDSSEGVAVESVGEGGGSGGDDVAAEERGEPVAEPPKLDWSVWKDGHDEVARAVERVEAPGASPDPVSEEASDDEIDQAFDKPAEPPPAEPEFLPAPDDFDGGPEVMDEVESEAFGGKAFDVSLPENDSEPDMTPVLPGDGQDDITVTPDDDEEEPVRRRRLWPLAVAAVAVLAAGGALLWPQIRTWLEPRDAAQLGDPVSMAGEAVEGVVVDVVEEAVDDPVGVADPVVEDTPEAPEDEPTTAPEPSPRDEVQAAAEPQAGPDPGPDPTPVPATEELADADTVTAIDVGSRAQGTVIRIIANGGLGGGAISVESLQSPPRVLVRLRGIEHDYRPYTIEASTDEVTRVRSGLHEERRPAELWVVIDLTGPAVEVEGIDIRGSVAELLLKRR